jgi:hypothetical protein
MPPGDTRRGFLRKLAGATAAAGLLGTTRALAEGDPPEVANAGWARLITPTPASNWNFHRDRDQWMAQFVASKTTLRFDPALVGVGLGTFDRLCRYPFLFAWDLTRVGEKEYWANLREYLYRGGFLYLENCVVVSPDLGAYHQGHLERLLRLLPGAEVRQLSPRHPIVESEFWQKQNALPPEKPDPRDRGLGRAFYGIYDDDRMVVLLSTARLFCGWPEQPEMVEPKMRQITRIYVYSRAH